MTKLIVALAATLVAASFASAADFILKDGRVLREAVIINQDAATVTFRHAGGFSQVEKSKLPESLAAEYPLDEAQAKLEAEQQRQETEARRADAERLYALRVQIAAAAPKPKEVPAYVEPKQSIASSIASLVDNYNAESWRLMRNRDRDHHDDRDRHNDRDHHNDGANHRDRECTPPTTQPIPTSRIAADTHMTPDVHITPDLKMVGFDTPQSSEVPPDADTTQLPPLHRRY